MDGFGVTDCFVESLNNLSDDKKGANFGFILQTFFSVRKIRANVQNVPHMITDTMTSVSYI